MPDSKHFVMSGKDGLTAWDLETGQRVSTAAYPAPEKMVPRSLKDELILVRNQHGRLAVAPDRKSVLYHQGEQLCRYPLPLAPPDVTLPEKGGNKPVSIACAAPSKEIFALNSKRQLVVWEPGEKRWKDVGAPAFTTERLTLAGTEGVLAIGGRIDFILLWDAVNGKELGTIDYGPEAIVLSADGKYLMTVTPPGKVRVWDVATRKGVSDWRPRNRISAWALSADGSLAACGGDPFG